MRKGKFITVEGPDGCGKTTISKFIANELKERGYDIIHTREPGGIDIAEQIRDIILNPRNVAMDAKTEALLYAASRRQHFVEKIKPALEADRIVLCERFVDSSLAYQGVGRELGIDEIYMINEFAIEGWLPDLTIFLDIDADTGLKRLESRVSKDRLDQENATFHQRVYEGYQTILQRYQDRMHIVDASKTLEEVQLDTLRILLEHLS